MVRFCFAFTILFLLAVADRASFFNYWLREYETREELHFNFQVKGGGEEFY